MITLFANSNWKQVPIESVYLGLYDGPHATPKPAAAGPIFLGIKNITEDGRLDLSEIRHIAEEDFSNWTRRVKPCPGDVVFTYEATLNRYAIIPQGFRGCLGRRLALIRPNPEKVDTRFLFYYFFGEDWRTTISKNTLSGSTVDRIPLTTFPAFKISIPPLPTQRKIAAILSAYDDLIENNTRRIAILEEMAQSLYREWFVYFRFHGHQKKRMVESQLGLIPEGWEVKSIGELLKYHIGGGWGQEEISPEFSQAAYVIRGTDIPSARYGSINGCPLRFHKQSNLETRQLQTKDIVFEVSGGSKGQPVGRALFVSQKLLDMFDENVICASFCKLLRVDEEIILPELLCLHLLEIYADERIEKYQVQSTGIINFKFTFFLESELVVVPDQIYQEKFRELINPLLVFVQTLGVKNANLRQSRNLLLPKLISGDVDVEGLDIHIEGETYESDSDKLPEISSGDEAVRYPDLSAHV